MRQTNKFRFKFVESHIIIIIIIIIIHVNVLLSPVNIIRLSSNKTTFDIQSIVLEWMAKTLHFTVDFNNLREHTVKYLEKETMYLNKLK